MVTPAIQAGIVNVRSPTGASTSSASRCPTPSQSPSPQRAVCVVPCPFSSNAQISEGRGDFSWFPVVVEVRSNAKGYSSIIQALFNAFLFDLQLSFGQMEVLLFLINLPPFFR